jgi:hypothetical protein
MRSVGPTLLRVTVTLLGVVAAVGQVNYLDALSWHRLNLTPPMMSAQMSGAFLTLLTAHAVVSIVAAALAGGLVLHEGPRQAAARALGLSLGCWAYLLAYSGVTLLLRPAGEGASQTIFDNHFLLVELAGLVGLLRFTTLFPGDLLERPISAPPTLPGALAPFHAASVWMLRPGAPWITAGVLAAAVWILAVAQGDPTSDAALSPAMDVFRVLAAGLTVLNLRRSWGRADGDGVIRLGWLLVALSSLVGILLLYIGGNVLVGVTEWPEPNVAWRPLLVDVGVLGFLIALAMSVMYGGTVDPLRLARRLVASAVVVTVGLFLAAALEALLSGGILAGITMRTGVGTAIAFATVVSTHRALIRTIERSLEQIPLPGTE